MPLDEVARLRGGLQLIAGENLSSSLAVLAAFGSVLDDEYAEGYPGHRYYGGCEVADRIEQIAAERAKRLFGAVIRRAAPQRHHGRPGGVRGPSAAGDTILGARA